MLNSKQRSNLRALASTLTPFTQVGKNGITESVIGALDEAIEKKELIKVTVLENADMDAKSAGFEIAERLNAEFVCATGKKLVFYRRSHKDGVKHIEF
jgi:RNA-binding protein